MNWRQVFKPTKWKVIVSSIPFIFPLFEIWLSFQIAHDLYVDVDNILFDIEEVVGGTLYISEVTLASPFEPILQPLGWWSRNVLTAAPDGPLLPGSFVVAITYSGLIYIIWSLISYWRKNRQGIRN